MYRRLHRWVSVVALFFVFWVSVTGVLLMLDTIFDPTRGDPAMWWNDISLRLPLHNLLQDLHRGSIIGLPGHLLGFLAGVSLTFLSVTGIVMYVQLLKRRRSNGHSQLFWSTGTGLLRYHRWIGSAGMIFLFYVALTGAFTSLAQLLDPSSTAPITLETAVNGPAAGPPQFGPPAAGGVQNAAMPPLGPPENAPLAAKLQVWHSGNIIGQPGLWMVLLVGISFIVLSVTGGLIYYQKWQQRKQQSQPGIFWQ